MSLRWLAPYLIPVLVLGSALFLSYSFGKDVAADHYEKVIADRDASAERARADALSDARREEQGRAAYVAMIDQTKQEHLRNAIQVRDNTIDDLRTGNLQLRQRFTCPAANNMPGASDGTGLDHEARRGGLQQTDAEFLVRFAGEADEVTIQLQACQAVLSLLISTPSNHRTQEVAP